MEDRLKIVIKPEDTLDIGMQEQEPLQLRLGNAVIPTGTTNYNELGNKPKINGVTLQGNKSASELGLVNKAGDTMTGALSVPTPLSVVGETGAHIQLFNSDTSDTSNPIGDFFISNTNRRITIREKAADGHRTDYNFPAPDGTSDTSYDVITSKGGTMIGYLQLPRAQFQDGDFPRITFLDSSTSTVVGSIINHNAQRRTLVRQVSSNGSEETFQFPSSSGATSSAYYDVITSKGGTMIGDLNVRNGHHFGVISPSIDTTTTPAETQGQDGLIVTDKNANSIGILGSYQQTNGNIGFSLYAARPYNGGLALNGFVLEVAPDGASAVGITAPMQWRKALNGQDIKVRSGTTVITPGSNSTSETVITSAQLATMFGITGSSPSNTTVVMSNGDYVANAVGVSSIYNSNVVGWKALFSEPISNPIRINWIAVYFGI